MAIGKQHNFYWAYNILGRTVIGSFVVEPLAELMQFIGNQPQMNKTSLEGLELSFSHHTLLIAVFIEKTCKTELRRHAVDNIHGGFTFDWGESYWEAEYKRIG